MSESVVAGARSLVMQKDGNLVVSDKDGKPRWAAMTRGEGNSARFQTDGNLVVYDSSNRALWASHTSGSNTRLVAQNDSNLVIYDGATAIWDRY